MSARRGQTLVLFALTLLLVTLMVLITLGIGARAKDRMEAQVTADAAAYSEAVSTARTLNGIALLNRAGISIEVSMAATQSLISWSGAARAAQTGPQLAKAVAQLNAMMAGTGCMATVPPPPVGWPLADLAAGKQVFSDQGAGGINGQQRYLLAKLQALLKNQAQAQSIAMMTNTTLRATPMPDAANRSLVEAILATSGSDGQAALHATMGSRGDPWVTARAGGSGVKIPGLSLVNGTGGGCGWGPPGPNMSGEGVSAYSDAKHRAQQVPHVTGTVSWGEDDGGPMVVSYYCAKNNKTYSVPAIQTDAWVASSAAEYDDDQHYYGGANEGVEGGFPVYKNHTLGTCWPGCPNVWTGFMGYDHKRLVQQPDLDAQPVTVSVLSRDYAAQPKQPWNLAFQFQMVGWGSFDNGSPTGTMKTNPVLRYQLAVSKGIAYYHRVNPANYKEPPNLFNPFWRATLISGDLDVESPLEVSVSAAGYPQHAAVLTALKGAGFKGY